MCSEEISTVVTESYHLKIKAIEITLLNVAIKEVRKQSSFTTLFKRNRILKNSKSTLKNVSSFFFYTESLYKDKLQILSRFQSF